MNENQFTYNEVYRKTNVKNARGRNARPAATYPNESCSESH